MSIRFIVSFFFLYVTTYVFAGLFVDRAGCYDIKGSLEGYKEPYATLAVLQGTRGEHRVHVKLPGAPVYVLSSKIQARVFVEEVGPAINVRGVGSLQGFVPVDDGVDMQKRPWAFVSANKEGCQ